MTITPVRRLRLAAALGGVTLAALAVVTTATVGSVGAAGAAPPQISDDQITQAGIGVMAFNLRNLTVDPITEPCPILAQDEIGWFFAQQGYTANFAGFHVDTYYSDNVGEGYPGVDCLSDLDGALEPDPAAPHYPAVGAAYLPEEITFQDFLTGFEDQTLLTPSVPGIGGEVGGVCIPDFCYLHWHRGSLIISVLAAGGTGDITREKTEAMLMSMVPPVVTNLIESLDAGMTLPSSTTATTVAPSTTVAAPTTAATPTTVPATTSAPTTTQAQPELPELPSSTYAVAPAPTKTTAA